MSISSATTLRRFSAGFAHYLLLSMTTAVLPTLLSATVLKIDFGQKLQAWDGFGANYVETRHTRDYTTFAQDYGGFKYLDHAEREQVVDLVFGDDGLRVHLLKIFLDPFHEKNNDNDDPLKADVSKFDHETTTRWIRYFARRGWEKTRARGDDLTVLVGLYGPPGWMSRQETFRGRDLKPGYEAEVAEYLAVFARHLRDVEGLPVRYISMHNEGESPGRWQPDGRDALVEYKRDYNMWWPDHQIVKFLRDARAVLDAHGLREVGLTSGETARWRAFHEHTSPEGSVRIAEAIRNDPAARANLALITSHGMRPRADNNRDPRAVKTLRAARPELHAWSTSATWGKMDVEIADDFRRLIYHVGTNGLIPWAMVHHDHESDKLSPPATVRVSTNAHSPIKTNNGKVEVTKAYHFYKQLTRAGQSGMSVAGVASDNDDLVSGMAFSGEGTKHPNAFVVINTTQKPQAVSLRIDHAGTNRFETRVTTDVAFGDRNYEETGIITLQDGSHVYHAPARSTTTFFAISRPSQTVFEDDFSEGSRGERVRNIISDPPPVGLSIRSDTPYGFKPRNWIIADREPEGPRRSLWCMPESATGAVETFMRQAGRSRDSIAYVAVPVPANTVGYVIEFKQWCNDNDYIGYVFGASRPALEHDGVEFGYERQLPKTDKTVKDAYYRGALGTGMLQEQSRMRRWVTHRIEVDGQTIRWYQDHTRMLEGDVPELKSGGYFGIRHKYDRGTRYDDVRITL